MKYNLYINDTIGYPISSHYVRQEMSKLAEGQPCAVYINSFGGAVADGLDIRQQFIDHGNVTAYIHGMTASAATILAMGAKRIVMGRFAFLLVHQCSIWQAEWGQMNAEDIAAALARLSKTAEDLKTIDHIVASIYAARSGCDFETMKKTMQDAAWLTAEQALALGLIDEIEDDTPTAAMTDHLKSRIMAHGLPLPPAVPTEGKGFLHRLGEKVQKTISLLHEPPLQEDEKEKSSNPFTMNKSFATLCALLDVEGIEQIESGFVLSAAQLEQLETSLQAAQTTADLLATAQQRTEELEAVISQLEAEKEELLKNDGADTPEARPESEPAESYGAASARKSFEVLKGLV